MENNNYKLRESVLRIAHAMPEHVREPFCHQVYMSLFEIKEMGHIDFQPFYFHDWQQQLSRSVDLLPHDFLAAVIHWAASLISQLADIKTTHEPTLH